MPGEGERVCKRHCRSPTPVPLPFGPRLFLPAVHGSCPSPPALCLAPLLGRPGGPDAAAGAGRCQPCYADAACLTSQRGTDGRRQKLLMNNTLIMSTVHSEPQRRLARLPSVHHALGLSPSASTSEQGRLLAGGLPPAPVLPQLQGAAPSSRLPSPLLLGSKSEAGDTAREGMSCTPPRCQGISIPAPRRAVACTPSPAMLSLERAQQFRRQRAPACVQRAGTCKGLQPGSSRLGQDVHRAQDTTDGHICLGAPSAEALAMPGSPPRPPSFLWAVQGAPSCSDPPARTTGRCRGWAGGVGCGRGVFAFEAVPERGAAGCSHRCDVGPERAHSCGSHLRHHKLPEGSAWAAGSWDEAKHGRHGIGRGA